MFTNHFYSQRNTGADIIRALAIILVLISHSRRLLPIDNTTSGMLTFGGWIGVELFFVLSGLLVGGLVYRQQITAGLSNSFFKTFLIRRWLRTIPAYMAVLFLMYYLYRFDWSYLFFFQTLVNYNSSYPALFPVSWSLVVEEFFYLFLAAAAFFYFKFIKSKNTTLYAAVTLLVFSLLAAFIFHNSFLIETYKMGWRAFPFRFTGLAAGVILAIYLNSHNLQSLLKSKTCKTLTVMLWVALLATYYLKITSLKAFFENSVLGFIYDMAGVLTCTLTVGILALKEWKFKPTFITLTATLSYSLYLVHYQVFKELMLGQHPPSWITAIAYLTISYFFAWLLFTLVELPFMRVRNRFFK